MMVINKAETHDGISLILSFWTKIYEEIVEYTEYFY